MEPAKRKRAIASTAAGPWLLLAGPGVAHAQDASTAVHIGRAVDLAGTPVALFRPKPPPAALSGKFAASGPVAMPAGMPVAARALTSGFGARFHPLLNERRAHLGIDLAAATGSPIVATSPGVVSAQGWYGGYGDLVVSTTAAGSRRATAICRAATSSPGSRSSAAT